MNTLEYLNDLISEKKYERKKLLFRLSRLNDEMKDLQNRIADCLIEQQKIDFQLNLFNKEREVNNESIG